MMSLKDQIICYVAHIFLHELREVAGKLFFIPSLELVHWVFETITTLQRVTNFIQSNL